MPTPPRKLKTLKAGVSVVTITKDRERLLKKCLSAVLKQSWLPDEFILIEDVSNKQTFNHDRLKTTFAGKVKTRYFKVKNANYGISRNLGLKWASNNLILFLDDDVLIPADYIAKIVSLHKQKPQALGFVGKVLPISKTVFSEFASFYMMDVHRFKKKVEPIKSYPTAVVALNKLLIEKQGFFFDEVMNTGEDIEFFLNSYEKGARLYFAPELVALHNFKTGPVSFFKRNYEYAKDFAYLQKKYPDEDILTGYFPKRKLEFIFFPLFCIKFIEQRIKGLIRDLKLENKYALPIGLQAISNLMGVYTSKAGLYFLKKSLSRVWQNSIGHEKEAAANS